jgi:hypothetical protein
MKKQSVGSIDLMGLKTPLEILKPHQTPQTYLKSRMPASGLWRLRLFGSEGHLLTQAFVSRDRAATSLVKDFKASIRLAKLREGKNENH